MATDAVKRVHLSIVGPLKPAVFPPLLKTIEGEAARIEWMHIQFEREPNQANAGQGGQATIEVAGVRDQESMLRKIGHFKGLEVRILNLDLESKRSK